MLWIFMWRKLTRKLTSVDLLNCIPDLPLQNSRFCKTIRNARGAIQASILGSDTVVFRKSCVEAVLMFMENGKKIFKKTSGICL